MAELDPALEALQARIRKAAEARAPLRIRGGGTKDFYGGLPQGDILETQVYAGIVEYQPTELVLTARAGTSLAAVESAMRARGQMLAFEPPHFGEGSTLGGAVASGLSGPRRPYAGAVRDLVLGVRVLDGTGQDLSFGGRVMKNVAGFDVARLMTGALGTLGVITEVSLKCLPAPKTEATLAFECSADEGIRRVNEWGRQPLPLSATCYHHGRMRVRLSGASSAVDGAVAKLGGERVADADDYWSSVRDHTHLFFAGRRTRTWTESNSWNGAADCAGSQRASARTSSACVSGPRQMGVTLHCSARPTRARACSSHRMAQCKRCTSGSRRPSTHSASSIAAGFILTSSADANQSRRRIPRHVRGP